MVNISRVRTELTGFTGQPGVSTMYFLDAIPPVAAVRAFWQALTPLMPATMSAQVVNSGDIIDDSTGDLVTTWVAAAQAVVSGTGTAAYSAPSGASVQWLTSTILDSHRVRGRTFVVPIPSSQYDTDGTLVPAAVAVLESAAAGLVTAGTPTFIVWHRPLTAAQAALRVPPGVAHPGGFAIVSGSRVADKAAILRSRRD